MITFVCVQVPDEQQVQVSKDLSPGEGPAHHLFLHHKRISFLYPFPHVTKLRAARKIAT